ncbi:hypothetical protein AVEN_8001-1 [Araneus ventricosus]|uniref:Uncharacterized protein n=1 Tax=Araneus ventricosus TaxID=182803 RepID=A0A4Y2RMI1_ARAVE|nr:hypothetical protein AVEN_8001-1 [Araneus ventricosus]
MSSEISVGNLKMAELMFIVKVDRDWGMSLVKILFNKLIKWFEERDMRGLSHFSKAKGHESFVTYLHMFRLCSHDLCVCGDKGDPNHYAADCPATKPFRFMKPSAENLSTCVKILFKAEDPWHDS